eukprot:GFUD01038309.1.p1 GENE.GFUD01038309.1~~GFUD01038309.1.p1  ORF type:complete len:2685 (-),score=552.78 GFUD01038309.1:99-8153(-)
MIMVCREIFHVFLLFLVLPFRSLAFHDMYVDEEGELMRPANWSDGRFEVMKLLRLREVLHEVVKGVSKDPELFPEEFNEPYVRRQRRKRSVDESNIGIETAPYVAEGLYRQERLLLPKVNLAPAVKRSINAKLFFGRYEGSPPVDLMFQVSASGNIQVAQVFESYDTEPKSLSGNFNVYLGNDAEITDVVLGYDTQYSQHFLAVAVKLVLAWPADSSNYAENDPRHMSVNDPVEMPANGRSRIYSFSLTGDSCTATLIKTLPTIEAVDAQFWTEDDELYLAIAHRGNYTTLSENTESVLLRHKYLLEEKFEIIQGYRGIDIPGNQIMTDMSFVTHNPKSVIQFNINSRSFIVFANQGAQTGVVNPNYVDDTYSYIYRFDVHNSLYELFAQVPTFFAVDVAFLQILDPTNPKNTQSFLVFANKEDPSANPIESFVYKYIDGQFLPFQFLKVDKPISVTTMTYRTTALYNEVTVDVLQHYIVFLTETQDLIFYQFDGTRFNIVKLNSKPNMAGATAVDTVMVANIPTLLVRYGTKNELCEVGFDTTSVSNLIFKSSQEIRSYVNYWTHKDNRLDFPSLQEKFDSAPKQGDVEISLTDVEFKGSFSVENIIIDPSLSPPEIDGESALEVDSKTNINSELITNLEKYTTGSETDNEKSLLNLKKVLDSYKTMIDASAKLDQVNTFAQDLHINEIEVSSVLSADVTDIDVPGSPVTHDGTTMVDLVSFMKNAKEIPSDTVTPVTFHEDMTFENIQIAGTYSITQINMAVLGKYVNVDDVRNIGSNITFTEGAVFKGAVTVDGTVDGVNLSPSKMLLKSGDQIIDDPVTLKGSVQLSALDTLLINGFNTRILNDALLTGQKTFSTNSITTLIVDELEIVAGGVSTTEQIEVLDSDLGKTSNVNLHDLITASMKKTQNNLIQLGYTFKDVDVTGDVSSSQLDFISISDSATTLYHPGTLILSDKTAVETDVLMTVNKAISSGTWTLSEANAYVSPDSTQDVKVDEDVNLDLLLLNPTDIPNYLHTVSADKKFTSVFFNEDVYLSGTVLGYNMNKIQSDNAAGVKIFSEDYFVNDLVLTGTQDISKLVLDNDVLLSDCTVPDDENVVSCTGSNNFFTVYNNGVKREDTSIPAYITSMTFKGAATFEKNLQVTSVNTLDTLDSGSVLYVNVNPDTDFLRRSGTGTFTFIAPIIFTGQTIFGEDIAQSVGAEVKVCQLGFNGQCLCSDCSIENDKCQVMGQVCMVKSSILDPSLYARNVSHMLSVIDNNSLKINGDQDIFPRLIFKGGFKADTLEVTSDDCTINTVACDNIALLTVDQTFTGTNKFHGGISVSNTVQVNSDLNVAGTVDTANMASIYSDSVMEETPDFSVQTITGRTTITKSFTVSSLITNNVKLLGVDVQPADLFSTDYVMKTDKTAAIASDIAFAEKPVLGQFSVSDPEVVTWDGVVVDKFFNNLWDNREQTIMADVRIEGNLVLSSGLSSINDASNFINNVNISDLESRALRISGTNIPAVNRKLDDATFVDIESTAADGILVKGNFLGVDLDIQAVKTQDNSNLNFIATKTFSTKPTVTGNLEINGNIVSISESSAMPQDELWNFLKNDVSVKKVKVTSASGASSLKEPTMTVVNNEDLNNLRTSKWYRKDDVELTYPITFNDVQFSSKLIATHLNNMDLVRWRDYYLSLSKVQDITKKYTFQNGVSFTVPVTVGQVFIGVDEKEGDLITEKKTHQFVDHYFKVLFTNMSYSLSPVLSPALADVAGSVLMSTDVKINNVDLSKDVLTYKTGDSKEFTNEVSITGNLVVIRGPGDTNGDLTSTNDYGLFFYDQLAVGVNSGPGVYDNGVQLSHNYLHGVKTTDSAEIEIEGAITFTANPTFSDLTLSSTFNGMDIGNCALPNILTTANCGTSGDQTITGGVQFGTDDSLRDVAFTKILKSSLLQVNSVSWQVLMDKIISKSKPGDVIFTGQKTFTNDLVIEPSVSTTMTSVFGLDLSSVLADVKGNTNMRYPSDGEKDPVMPDLAEAIQKIAENSAFLPKEFLYMQPIITENNMNMRVRTLGMMNPDKLDMDIVYLASLSGDITTGQVQLKLNRISFVKGIAQSESIDVDTQKFSIGADGFLGDMVGIVDDNKDFYYLLSSRSDTFDESKPMDILETSIDTDSTFYNFFYVWNSAKPELLVRQIFKETILDLEPVRIKTSDSHRSCIIVCGLTTRILCPTTHTESGKVYLEAYSSVLETTPPDTCFQASVTNITEHKDVLALVRGKDSTMGRVDIYMDENDQYVNVQTIPCYLCSGANLGSYYDQQKKVQRVFVAIVSYSANFAYVGELVDNKFELYQMLDVYQPSQATFYTCRRTSSLFLSVLSGVQATSKVSTFVLQGSMGFLLVPDKSFSLPGITEHQVLFHSSLQSQLITTSGITPSFHSTGLSANTVMQALYKQSNVSTIRSEVANNLTPIPSFISEQCRQMVTDYAGKLYDQQRGPATPEMYAKLLLRLLPRPYLEYSTSTFSTAVQDILASPTEQFLMDNNPANAVVNLYKYTSTLTKDRDMTDGGYVGTAFVYQDLDGVLYVYTRFKDDPYNSAQTSSKYRQVSFWTSCEEDAAELSSETFATPSQVSKFSPVETGSGDGVTQTLCTMVHDFEWREELKTIKGKAWVGALSIAGWDGSQLACGLLKHPEQAMVQFLTDHAESNINFHPFGQNF